MTDEAAACRRVLVDCLATRPSEDVLVVADPPQRPLGEALVEAARAIGTEAVLVEMEERSGHGVEPPRHVAAAMVASAVVAAPTSKSLSHTAARRAACEQGARVASMPRVSVEMLARTMRADAAEVARRAHAVADALTSGSEVHVTSEGGTDVVLSIEGRSGIADDGDLSAPGSFGNLPAGEGFIAPVEGRTQGRIVFDGAALMLGAPLVAIVEDGYATAWEQDATGWAESTVRAHGRDALAIAELGIGTNDAAVLSGNVIEDEKVLGTVHLAFGDNHSFGGTTRVASHQDFVVLEPTVTIDGTDVLAEGRLLL